MHLYNNEGLEPKTSKMHTMTTKPIKSMQKSPMCARKPIKRKRAQYEPASPLCASKPINCKRAHLAQASPLIASEPIKRQQAH